jgi:hypothetical protein
MAAPSTFIPDSAPASFEPDAPNSNAPKTFVADHISTPLPTPGLAGQIWQGLTKPVPFSEMKEDILRPLPGIRPLESKEIKPTDSFTSAAGKEAYNLAISIPNFIATPAGLATAATGGTGGTVAKAATSLFSAQAWQQAGEALLNLIPNWHKLSSPEKAKAMVDVGGNSIFGALMARGTKTKADAIIDQKIAPTAPATAEAVKQTIAQVAAKTGENPPPKIVDESGNAAAITTDKGLDLRATTPEAPPAVPKPSEPQTPVAEPNAPQIKPQVAKTAIKPAIVVEGKVVEAQPGEHHADIEDRVGTGDKPVQEGFVENGQFKTREQVAEEHPEIPTTVEPGKVHTEDLEKISQPEVESKNAPVENDKEEGVQTPPGANPGTSKLSPAVRQSTPQSLGGKDTTQKSGKQLKNAPVAESVATPTSAAKPPAPEQALAAAPAQEGVKPSASQDAAFEAAGAASRHAWESDTVQAHQNAIKFHEAAKAAGNDAEYHNDFIQRHAQAIEKIKSGQSGRPAPGGQEAAPSVVKPEGKPAIEPVAAKPAQTEPDYISPEELIARQPKAIPSETVAKIEAEEAAYREQTKPSAPTVQKYRIGNNPQLHTLVERLPQSEIEKENGEQPVRIKNDKTGEVQTVLENELQPVKERTEEERAATKKVSDKDLNKALIAAKLDPSVLQNAAQKRAALKRAKAMTGMGGAVPEEFSSPTIEDSISGNPLAPIREPKPQPLTAGSNTETISGLSKAVDDAITSTKGWIGAMAGKTFPRTTLISKQLGELGGRWISSKIAARPKSELFTAEVLGDSGLSSRDVGAALTEDNLRSIKQSYEEGGDQESADSVQTLIGKKGSTFKTEREYQDFLSNPKFQEVVKRHKDMWQNTVEPQHRAAMQLDPDVELPSRGLQTGARINLRAVQEGENMANTIKTAAQGNLLGTLRKKSPFGVRATGAADAYHTDLYDLMENTFGKQDEIANKNAFEKALVESGNALIDKPGQTVTIGGGKAVAFPLKRSTVIVKGGKPISQNRMLYVNPRIASEYRIGAKVDPFPEKGVLSAITKVMNVTAIASGTEATTHIMNLGSALFALPSTSGRLLNDALLSTFGRADIPVKIVRVISKSMQDNRAQIAGLSEIGAMREKHATGTPILKYGTKMIQWMDTNTRLVLDDAYQQMKKDGLVDPSETARREFVNQVGQYNTRAQPYLMGQMRKLGISPFVTAGKNFNTLGIREATLNPGVKATSVPAALALRANMLSKWIGTQALICTANYLLTKDKGGGAMGRPGTPLGSIDTGEKDKNGRNVYVNVLNITGQGRALRVTGLKGFIDSERMGLTTSSAVDTASRDMINSAISPWAGPAPRFVLGASTGQATAVNVGRQYPVVPPGTSQHLSDFKNAVINLSPVTGGIQKAMQPQNQGWWEIVKSQFPRLVPQSGRPDSMTKNFPEIVEKAQSNEFMDYVIHASRTIPIDQRHEFLTAQIGRLPSELREKAWTEVKWKRAMSQ